MGWYLLGIIPFFLTDQACSAIARIPARPVASLVYALAWPVSFPATMIMSAMLERRRQDAEQAPTAVHIPPSL